MIVLIGRFRMRYAIGTFLQDQTAEPGTIKRDMDRAGVERHAVEEAAQ